MLLAVALLRAAPVVAAGVVGTGTPGSCTEAALDAALVGAGLVTFDCGPDPVTITITSTKVMDADTTIDGGGMVTLSGGGAVRIFTVDDWSTALEVRNLTIADGRAQSSGEWPFGIGGGIYNAGALTLTNCALSGNSEGGIANNGTLTLTNCTLSGNTAGVDRGGGIYNWGTATLTNCTLSGNAAGVGGGGALFNQGTASLTNCTLSENARGPGVAIVSYLFCAPFGGCTGGPLTLTNTIITDSAGVSCSVDSGSNIDPFYDGGHNLQFPGTSCGVTIQSSLDPLLDTAGLTDNGGPTQTIALLPGSPAINAGDQAVCGTPPVNHVDQRGYGRPGRGHTRCSIGAYEADASPPAVCIGDCDRNGVVAINELILGVNIALALQAADACPEFATSEGVVDIAQLIQGVENTLGACGNG